VRYGCIVCNYYLIPKMIWSLACTGLAGVGFDFSWGSRSVAWAAGLGFAFSGLVPNLLNRLASLNKTGWERGSRERTGTSSPFSQCRHGSMPELSELHGYGATGLHSRSQGYGEREEGKGVQSWGFPMGLLLKKEGTTGGHGWRPASSWRALYRKG